MKNLHLLSLFVAALLLTTSFNTYAQDDEQTGTKHYVLCVDNPDTGAEVAFDFNHFIPVAIIGNSGMYLTFEKVEQIGYSSYYGKVANKVNSKPTFNNSCLRELHPNYPA